MNNLNYIINNNFYYLFYSKNIHHKTMKTNRRMQLNSVLMALLLGTGISTKTFAAVNLENGEFILGGLGAICRSVDPQPNTNSTWTCDIPTSSGGIATVSGLKTIGSGAIARPDPQELADFITNNLGSNSILIGDTTTTAKGNNSIAIGSGANANGNNSVAVGQGSHATGNETTALGQGAVASGAGSVALGSNSNDGGRANVVSVGAAGAERQISNVAPGTQGTDAVNVNQLKQFGGDLQIQIDATRHEANAGTAGAMAMAGMPQAYLPGKSMVAVGAASFRGESALALGMSHISNNGRWVTKFTGSANSRGHVGVTVGGGYQW